MGRHSVKALTATLIAGVATLAAPGSAGAENLGTAGSLTYMRDSVLSVTPGTTASPVVECPAGQHLTGGGIDAVRGYPYGILNSSNPVDGSDGNSRPDDAWIGRVVNTSADTLPADAYAICSGGRPKVRSSTVHVQPDQPGAARAACPSGTHVTGGGADQNGFTIADAWVTVSLPLDGPDRGTAPDDGWRARVFNSSGDRESLSVFALCRSASPRYHTATGGFANNSAGTNLGLPCGARHVAGAGGAVSGAPRLHWLSGLWPRDEPAAAEEDSVPDDYAPAEAVSVASTGSYSITSASICLP
jgi:hypothetical protein